jgi:hypothetical protein
MSKSKRTPSTHKLRRDVTGGKRGNGNRRSRAIRRPDPTKIKLGKTDATLTGVAGLVMLGVFLRGLGVDRELAQSFSSLKAGHGVVYPMQAVMRMLLDAFVTGEHRVFGIESLAADPLFVH